MSDALANSESLGSAHAEVGYTYDPRGMDRFLAAGREAAQLITQFRAGLAGPFAAPGLQQPAQQIQQLGSSVERLRAQLQQANVFSPLQQQAADASLAARKQMEALEQKAESLAAKLASIGIDRSQLRGLFDAEGQIRDSVVVRADRQSSAERGQRNQYTAAFGAVRTSANQRFEALQQQADPGTQLARADDINAIKQLAEEARDAYAALDTVELQLKNLESAAPKNLPKPLQEGAQALERFEVATVAATAAQQELIASGQRLETLKARLDRVLPVFNEPDLSDQRAMRAGDVGDRIESQLTATIERYTRAQQAAAEADAERAAALAQVQRAERDLEQRSQRSPAAQDARALIQATAKVAAAEEQRAAATTTADATIKAAQEQRIAQVKAAEIAAQTQAQNAKLASITLTTAAQAQAAAKVEAADRVAAGKTTAAQIAGSTRVEAARLAAVARVESAEKTATARHAAAQIAADAKVEAARIRAASQRNTGGGGLQFGQAALDVAGGIGLANGVEAAVQQGAQFVSQSITLANNFEDTRASIEGIAFDSLIGAAQFDLIQRRSRAMGVNVQQTAQAFTPIVAGLREMPELFAQAVNNAERLSLANRFQGLDGASFALNEFLSTGDTVSISDRFNLPAAPFKKLRDETRDITDVTEQYERRLEGVNQILNDFGYTNDRLADSLKTQAADFRRAQADLVQAQTEVGNVLATGLAPAARGLSALVTGGRANTEALEQQNAAAVSLSTSYQAYQENVQRVLEANASVVGTLQVLTPEQYAYVQALRETGVGIDEAVARSQKLRTIMTLIAQEIPAQDQPIAGLLDFLPGVEQIPQATGPAQAALTELKDELLAIAEVSDEGSAEVQRLVIGLRDGTIGPDQFRAAVASLTVELVDGTAASRAAAAARLSQARADDQAAEAAEKLAAAQRELESALTSAGGELVQARERRDDQLTSLEEKYLQKVEDLNQRAQDQKEETEDAILDATREAADERLDIVQEAAERESEVVTDFAERRAKLIQDQQTRQAERDRQFQDEQARAQRAAEASALESRATFLQRLNQLTNQRGGGGAKARAEARAQRAANQAQVDELARIDPAAAAELQKELDQQLIENLERKRENAQRVKDSRRGGSLSQAEAKRQIDEENQAETAAQQARIEAIKRGAVDRQQQRDEERAKQQASDQQALDDLNKQEAAQLDKVRSATTERLREFDVRQTERIAQLKKHADEQQAEIQRQLAAEEGEYKKSRDQINRDYARFLLDLREELQKQANSLNLTPEQARQQELADAYRAIGQELGQAFADGLQQAARTGTLPAPSSDLGREPQPQRRPPANSPGTFSRGSRVGSSADKVISDQGIDQVVQGGVQTDGFNSKRDSTGTHAGVDIAAKEGTPIKTPVAGTVQSLPDHPVFGKRIIIAGDDGSEWYFGHLQRSLAGNGARVKAGQTVAQVGSTGHVSGPHLHLQYKPGSGEAAQDPTALLEQLAQQPAQAQASAVGGARAGGSPTPQSATTRPISQTQAPAGGLEALAISPLQAMGDRASASASAPPVQVDRSIHVSVSGPFAPGVSMDQVKQAVRQGVEEGIAAESRNISQQLSQLDTKGALAL